MAINRFESWASLSRQEEKANLKRRKLIKAMIAGGLTSVLWGLPRKAKARKIITGLDANVIHNLVNQCNILSEWEEK